METIEKGKYFEIVYQLFRINADRSEDLVHEVTEDEPDCAICGKTYDLVAALDTKLVGLAAGDAFDFVASPEEAFGPYSDEAVFTIPREQMTVDGKFDESMFTPGALIPLMTPDGFRIDGSVVKLTPEAVIVDLNHPLAKNEVHYVGKVISVRDASEEELKAAEGIGCGGCSCSGGCEGGCGDNSGGCGCGGGCCQ